MQGMTVADIEKILLREYLHSVIDTGWNAEQAQHEQINQIILYNLKHPPPANPANPSED